MNPSQDLQRLHAFRNLPETLIRRIAGFCISRRLEAGEILFRENESAQAAYGLLAGLIRIEHQSADPRFSSKTLSLLSPGSVFGEAAFLGHQRRSAAAVAVEPSDLLVIDGDRFRSWMDSEPAEATPVLRHLMGSLLERLHETNLELAILHGLGRILGESRPLEERLIDALQYLGPALPDARDLRLYDRSPYWEEMNCVCSFPGAPGEALPLNHPMVRSAVECASDQISVQSAVSNADWGDRAVPGIRTWLIAPFVRKDISVSDISGLLVIGSARGPEAITPSARRLIHSVAVLFAQSLADHARLQDRQAQQRFRDTRQSFNY